MTGKAPKPFSIKTIDGYDALWDRNAVAQHLGIKPTSLDSYIYRSEGTMAFPEPVNDPALLMVDGQTIGHDAVRALLARAGGETPLRLWRATEVIAWHNRRPRASK